MYSITIIGKILILYYNFKTENSFYNCIVYAINLIITPLQKCDFQVQIITICLATDHDSIQTSQII